MIALPSSAGPTQRHARPGFTLVELLVTITIITILSGMITFAMYRVQEMSRIEKTQALIARLNNIVMDRWDSYRTRRVPVSIDVTVQLRPKAAAKARLDALRELMRMELPDRWSDVVDNPITPAVLTNPPSALPTIQRPSVSMEYLRRYGQVTAARGKPPSADNQRAECLYLIVMARVSDDASPRDLFSTGEIGDVDDDGMPEFLDAWGNPIRFLRWAPGFRSELQPGPGTNDDKFPPDTFDPLRIYGSDPAKPTFALYPLIYSAGPDKAYDIYGGPPCAIHAKSGEKPFDYARGGNNNNPYAGINDPAFVNGQIGTPADMDGDGVDGPDGRLGHLDNIHNHLLGVRQ